MDKIQAKILKNVRKSRCPRCYRTQCTKCRDGFDPKQYRDIENIVLRLLYLNRLEANYLDGIINDTESHYNVYYKEKKDGGKRRICSVDSKLRQIQRLILPLIVKPKCSKYAKGYERGTNIKDNAAVHSKSSHILHMDISNFFPSITKELFNNTYGKYYTQDEVDTLWKIVSYKGGIAVGAATSPFIANRILYETDVKMNKVVKKAKYTRFADDILFSSKKFIDDSIVDDIKAIMNESGFEINDKKTYFMSYRREVTGIILTDDNKLSTGTSFKKGVKKEVYNLLALKKGNPKRVRGKLAYLYDIEPKYARVIKDKYGHLDKKGLMDFIK